jgi:hypothetical protein
MRSLVAIRCAKGDWPIDRESAWPMNRRHAGADSRTGRNPVSDPNKVEGITGLEG